MRDKLSCLIFDFDGVIANTDLGRYIILNKLLDNYGVKLLKPFKKNDLIGMSTRGFLKRYATCISDSKIDKIVKKRHEIFFSNLNKYCIPYDNMKATISYFHSNFDLAVATTNELNNVEIQLDYLGVLDCFKWIIGRDITQNSNFEKTYQLIPETINKKVSECIVIEDSDFGVNAAVEEGFYCIRFDPDNIFPRGVENEKVFDYYELKDLIDRKTKKECR